jgi:hypothetical protein
MYAAGKWKIRVFSWTYSVEVDVHVVVDVDGFSGLVRLNPITSTITSTKYA